MYPDSPPPTSQKSARSVLPWRPARHADGAVVLLGAADPVREVVGRGDVVELRRGKSWSVQLAPPSVVTDELHRRQPRSSAGRCPGRSRGRGCRRAAAKPLEGLAAVRRADGPTFGTYTTVLVLRIGVDAGVVPGALPEVAVLLVMVQVAPASSERNTPPESDSMIAQTRFELAPLHRDADLADQALRQARVARDLVPGVTAVGAS